MCEVIQKRFTQQRKNMWTRERYSLRMAGMTSQRSYYLLTTHSGCVRNHSLVARVLYSNFVVVSEFLVTQM